MVFIIVTVVSILAILFGKIIFRKWINHLTLYSIIWGGLILLYEWKLLPYINIIPLAWFYIISAFLSFLLGILTIISARNLFSNNQIFLKKPDVTLTIFADDGKTVKFTLLFLSVICLFSAIQHWMVLIKMFGSIPAVIINANVVYKLNVSRDIKGFIPYLPIIGYVAIFFSGIYAAYKGRFSMLTFFPFVGIILKELATVGRAGILLALVEFLFSFFLFRHLLKTDTTQKFKFSKKNAVLASAILVIFLIASSSLIRLSRGSAEYYSGASRELRQMKENIILTPSVYLYLSSTVGVLSQYSKKEGENIKFGQNTFLPIYDILAKLDLFKRTYDVQKGYFIPMWTNTGTYIRELHADFGIAGVFLGPFLVGFLITWLWFKFYERKNLIVFAFLVYLNLIIGFSFLEMVTRISYWFYSLIFILILIPFVEKIATIVGKKPN